MAGKCFDVLWVHQLTLIGTSHGIQYLAEYHVFVFFPSHLLAAIKFSKCGQRNIYPNIGHLQITLLYLMTVAGRNASCIGTQEVEGVDAHFRMANSNTRFVRWHHLGTWLDIARHTGFWFQYYTEPRAFVIFTFSYTICTYNVWAFQFQFPNWAALGIQDQSHFFFFPLLFPQPSLVQTVLLVGLQANEEHEGQKSSAHAGA